MLANTVITAAGNSLSLFLPAGFVTPKSLIEVDGEPVIAKAIASYWIGEGSLVVGVNEIEEDSYRISRAVREKAPTAECVPVPDKSAGALISALYCAKDLNPDSPLVIASGDSVFHGDIADVLAGFQDRNLSAATLAFQSDNSRWSYLRLNPENQIIEVAEKRVIGPLATTGFFYFESTQMFIEAAKWVLVNNVNFQGRFYVSSALNYLISRGMNLGYTLADKANFRAYSLPIDFAFPSR